MPKSPVNKPVTRILSVEDNAVNQMVLTELLAAEGVEVDAAENGKVAVQMASQRRYDLIFMDIRMPQMDGMEAAKKIHALPGQNRNQGRTPIVAVSADNSQNYSASGFCDSVEKPYNFAQLTAVLNRWVDGFVATVAVATPPDSLDEPVLDPARITFLRKTYGQLPTELFHATIATLTDLNNTLTIALASKDLQQIIDLAHSMKSVGGNTGAMALQTAASAAETTPTCIAGTRLSAACSDAIEALRQVINPASPVDP